MAVLSDLQAAELTVATADSRTVPALGQPFHSVGQGTVNSSLSDATRHGPCPALTTNTMLTIALTHLRWLGVRLETHEAVALVRELLVQPCGIPAPENIQLGADGLASCIITDGMPSVATVADLLQTLLPAGTRTCLRRFAMQSRAGSRSSKRRRLDRSASSRTRWRRSKRDRVATC